MKMSDERQISAPVEEVWTKLNDIEVLKRCIPGCQSLEEAGENKLAAVVAVKIGPVNARFNGNVELSDINPPTSYRISGSGKGGAAGQASGGADVRLSPNDDGTLLSYDVDAKVSGKIAQLGSRLIDATAANLANRFFDNFAQELNPPGAEDNGEPAGASSPERPEPTSTRLPPLVWWIAGAAILAGLVYTFAG